MSSTSSIPVLRRYTNLPALLYLLRTKCITLLDPSSWDDKNDSYYLQKYKEKRNLKTVLALCMSEAEETYHHWHVFSNGSAGICIRFDRQALLAAFDAIPGATHGSVNYGRVRDAKRQQTNLKLEELPFLKRAGFSPECEYRALYTSETASLRVLDVPISLNSIVEITLSPWLSSTLRHCVRDTIKSIPGCESLEVHRSTLIGNSTWKKLADNAT